MTTPSLVEKKRISFDVRDAGHIYEWVLALRQSGVECVQKNSGCIHCELIANRIGKFIGPKEAAWYARQLKKHPYFPRPNITNPIG